MHLSVLKYISQYSKDADKSSAVINAGIYLTAMLAAVVALLTFFARDPFSLIFSSPGVGTGVAFIAPGLFFFALNKVLIAYHNGCRRMKAVAVFQALRYIFLLSCLWVFIAISLDGEKLTAIFSISEFLLFIGLFIYSLLFFKMGISRQLRSWFAQHTRFGFKAAPGNILDVSNTRVGVIILGIFASDAVVGVFSFAQMMAEGFAQLAVVFKMNINPILTKIKYEKGNEALREIVYRGRNISYLIMVPLGIIACLIFPFVVNILHLEGELSRAWLLFAIIMVMYMVSVGYMPFMMLLSQTGSPGYHSMLILAIFIVNVALNLALVPVLGMYGAAIATGLSFIAAVLFLRLLAQKSLQINI